MTLPRDPRRRPAVRDITAEVAADLAAAEAPDDTRAELAELRGLMASPGWALMVREIDRLIDVNRDQLEQVGAPVAVYDFARGAIATLRSLRKYPVERSTSLAAALERVTPDPATGEEIRARGGPRA